MTKVYVATSQEDLGIYMGDIGGRRGVQNNTLHRPIVYGLLDRIFFAVKCLTADETQKNVNIQEWCGATGRRPTVRQMSAARCSPKSPALNILLAETP